MATHARITTDETEIRNSIEAWAEALRAKNLERLLSFYTPDVRAFDVAPPLEHDRQAMRRGLEEWLPTWRGAIGYEIRDLRITASADVAFGTSLVHLTGERTSGEGTNVWMRSTVCLRKVGGRWLVAHEHVSVPFAMDGSYRALVDLKPQ